MQIQLGILLGLGTVVLWGIGDFYAALLCRRYGIQRTLLWTQFLALGLAAFPALLGLWDKGALNLFSSTPSLVLLGGLGAIQAVSYVAFYKGMAEGVVSVVSPLSASWAFIALLWAWLVWQEQLSRWQYAGVVLLLVGIILTALQLTEVKKLTSLQLTKGTIEGLIAMLLWGISFTALVPLTRQWGWYLPVMLMRFFAFAFLLFFFALLPRFLAVPRTFSLPFLSFSVVAVCDIGGVFCYSEGVRSSLASIVAPVASAFPLITVLLAHFALREKIAVTQKIGIAGVITGLILLARG